MTKAMEVAGQGAKYLGVPYSQMDCQAFWEACLKDCGMRFNLAGSNAWYRAMTWTGTPEECKARFGKIPVGACLFILKQDGQEPGRYRGDGIGNASHIGIYLGTGEGAIHSSSSRGCVCYSTFKGKSISGGWNRVGLWGLLDYDGLQVTPEPKSGGKPDAKPEPAPALAAGPATVTSANGGSVNVRSVPGGAKQAQLQPGTEVEILDVSGKWARIAYRQEGWMMVDFLTGGVG